MSLLAGCWWAAPVPRVEMAHRVFLRPECGACGRTSECLPLHLLAGQCPGEAPCPCVEASRCRAEWEAEVGRLYAQYADAEATVAFALATPRTLQRAALMLGWARGVELPWELSCALPRAFADTWGAWSQDRLDALEAEDAQQRAGG